jgi:hypothetical protein
MFRFSGETYNRSIHKMMFGFTVHNNALQRAHNPAVG